MKAAQAHEEKAHKYIWRTDAFERYLENRDLKIRDAAKRYWKSEESEKPGREHDWRLRDGGMRERLKTALVCLSLATAVFILYAQVLDHPFIWLDDQHYIVSNTHVNGGFSLENVAWAFKFSQTGDKTYWHPLVWFSHMLDCQLFGLNAGLHHLSNVMYHALNAVLLFLALRLMTGSLWRSAFAAALFALHPVNVDTTAWLAERKNLLSTTF